MTGIGEQRPLDPEREWSGLIAHVQVPTIDRRVVDSLVWALPLPVTAIVSSDFPSVVGIIRTVEIRDETEVWATGVVNDDRLPAGLHAVGIEVTEVDFTPTEYTQHIDARLKCLRLYTNSTLKPAWPDVAIEVAS